MIQKVSSHLFIQLMIFELHSLPMLEQWQWRGGHSLPLLGGSGCETELTPQTSPRTKVEESLKFWGIRRMALWR